jgi:protein-S-isoprenylcysteine O-methyltransferase Ste14
LRTLLLNLALTTLFFGLIPAGLIFGLSGRLDLWNVWAYLAIGVGLFTYQTLVLYAKSPEVLKERFETVTSGSQGRVKWTVGRASSALSIVQWLIVGLDLRFHWSDIFPPAWLAGGLVFYGIGWGVFTWAALENAFFSPEVRIQSERGQRVIGEGPYAIVRHPGYASNLLALFASAVALNSLLAIVPALAFLALVIRVTGIEDRMLQAELPGYAEYAARVRYRLLPSVW